MKQQRDLLVKEQLDLIAVAKLFWHQRVLAAAIIAISAALSIWYALAQEEIYLADLRAVPSEFSLTPTQNSLLETAQLRLGGMAFASAEYEKHLVAVKILRSRGFIEDFIRRHKLIPLIYAVTGWNAQSNTLEWDLDLYDPDTETWKQPDPPSFQDATQKFRLDNVMLEDDRIKRTLTLKVYHQSPVIAATWAVLLLNDLNEHMQSLEIAKINEKLGFYRANLSLTDQASSRMFLLEQIEKEEINLLLTRAANEFMFEIIDPPLVAERRAAPRRGLLVIIGTTLGGILALISIFLRLLLQPSLAQNIINGSNNEQ